MKILIRVDASIFIGSGHVMRCLVLANSLKDLGWNVCFVCRDQDGDLIEYIQSQFFIVYKLNAVTYVKKPKHSADYASWLQVTNIEDAEAFVDIANEVDLVIVDHYGIDEKWENFVKNKLGCKLFVVDDLDRLHDCDLLLDQNLWPDIELRYSNSKVKTKLLGPKYALLRPKFRELRQFKKEKADQIVVFFGGSDPTNECLKVVNALNQLENLPFVVQLVAGKSNNAFNELVQLNKNPFLKICKFITDFESELASSKYVIGASGVSNWERFCLNIPSTIVAVAENQRLLSEYLSELHLVNYLGEGKYTTQETYCNEFERLANNWPKVKKYKQIEVDGLGVDRVVNMIKEVI